MAIARWNPAREIDTLRGEMDRLVDSFLSPAANRGYTPAIRVWESAESYTVQAIVPGLDRNSLDIQAAPNGLSLSGKVHFALPEGVTVRHSEYGNVEFRRTLQFAAQIRSDEVKASYSDGILTVVLPKTDAQRVVRVALDAGSEN
jgi:HSP20 family protein